MWRLRVSVLAGILLMVAGFPAQAEKLYSDPAWRQGILDNGLHWQILATPQRPNDKVELRLLVNVGSLAESPSETGYGQLLARQAMAHSHECTDPQQQAPSVLVLSPAVISYNFTLYRISLSGNRPNEIKEALRWLATTAGELTLDQPCVAPVSGAEDPVITWPLDTQDSGWRYRLNGSALLDHDPATSAIAPVNMDALKRYYQKWYTPDAVTLLVAGNIDSRDVIEQINHFFAPLSGKRHQAPPQPFLLPLPSKPTQLVSKALKPDRLSLIWDDSMLPVQDSDHLMQLWKRDLAREALFWHVQRVLSGNKARGVQVGFDCRTFYLRAQCAINVESGHDTVEANLLLIAHELASIRDHGLPEDEYHVLLSQKKVELEQLFANYAQISTEVLINQRLRSQQSAVIDVAPEQYQILRRQFLSRLTLALLNLEIEQQLIQGQSIILMQPPGEPALSIDKLYAEWQNIMHKT